jgi:hypothetical protein
LSAAFDFDFVQSDSSASQATTHTKKATLPSKAADKSVRPARAELFWLKVSSIVANS